MSTSDQIREKATNAVFDKFSKKNPGSALDSGILSIILDALMAILENCKEKNSPQEVEELAKSSRFFKRIRAKRQARVALRRSLADDEWNNYGPQIIESVFEAAEESRPGEITALANVSENDQ